jgi:hypothetical protein
MFYPACLKWQLHLTCGDKQIKRYHSPLRELGKVGSSTVPPELDIGATKKSNMGQPWGLMMWRNSWTSLPWNCLRNSSMWISRRRCRLLIRAQIILRMMEWPVFEHPACGSREYAILEHLCKCWHMEASTYLLHSRMELWLKIGGVLWQWTPDNEVCTQWMIDIQ